MSRRLSIYFKEMFPLPSRLFISFVLFFEISFLTILTNGVLPSHIQIDLADIVGAMTICWFLMFLRIADDFKDFELDSRLFPTRPLPSGSVLKKDLLLVISVFSIVIFVLNYIVMNNFIFFLFLAFYGFLMSTWFFHKTEIQNSLPLALVTHNPVQIVMNIYILSYVCRKYNIPYFSLNNLAIIITLYFPSLVWEISRKVRAPRDETEYVTYSKLFGYKKATNFIMLVMFFDLLSTSFLLYQLYPWSCVTVLVSYIGLCVACQLFKKDPTQFKLVRAIEIFELITEITVLIFIIAFIGRDVIL